MDWIAKINDAVVNGRKKEVGQLVADAIAGGVPAPDVVNQAVTPAMNTVSELWKKGDYFVPEVMRSAATMQAAMDALKPYLVSGEHGKGVKIAIGTVKGDIHDIGKNLVAIMLEGVGYEIENLGVDLPPERFVDAVRNGARVIGMSSLLTTSMPEMQKAAAALNESDLRGQVTLIVGGAPITPDFARTIGADHYANDASEAVDILNGIFG
ncbi:MAG: corrinoid protein [Proteobacteria bacterium]|nr:corrinoid protein [Pseudomonadota bacterium]